MTTDAGDRPVLPGLELQELRARTNLNEVWRGVRTDTGEAVAVKLARTAAGHESLRAEAEVVDSLMAARVRRVVPVEHRTAPVPHLVFPWKGGRTLRDALSESRGADGRAKNSKLLLDVVRIVADAHRRGYLHGDLKPENVLIDDRGEAWLTDFGMARAIRTARLESHVSLSMSESAGGWGGTLQYLPPEGLQGGMPEIRWDVYALGVMLHEALLGRRPDRAATPEQLKSVLPDDIVQVLLEALAYSPKDRMPSASVLLHRLEDIGSELTARGPARWLLRSRRGLVVGLAAFFVLLRFASVLALLGTYVGILAATILGHPAFFFCYLPFIPLHLVIRWEGPETGAESMARQRGMVRSG